MVELLVHRFTDCEKFPQGASLRMQHALSTTTLQRVTCPCCKARILDVVLKRRWSQLVSAEVEALEIAAAEAEDNQVPSPAVKSTTSSR